MEPSETRHIHIFGVETWFKYQNNKQNLQICDMQMSQILSWLILWDRSHITATCPRTNI